MTRSMLELVKRISNYLVRNYKAYLVIVLALIATLILKAAFDSVVRTSNLLFLWFSWVVAIGAYGAGLAGGGVAVLLCTVWIAIFFLLPQNNWQNLDAPDLIRLLVFSAQGLLITLIITHLKISKSELNQTLIDLKQTHLKFNLLVRNAQGVALIFLSKDGNITEWNAGAKRLLGYRSEDVLEKPFSILFSRDRKQNWNQGLAEIIRNDEQTKETWLKLPNNRELWCNLTFISLRNKRKKLMGIGVICRDRTEGKELELQKDAFLDGASHELKTPLTTIKLLSQTLLKKQTENSDAEKILQKIDLQVNRVVELINLLLDIGKLQKHTLKLQFSIFPFQRLIDGILARFNSSRLKVNSFPSIADTYIVADEKRLKSALFQLFHYLVTDIGSHSQIQLVVDKGEQNTVMLGVYVPDVNRAMWQETRSLLGEVKRDFYTDQKGDKGVGLFFATHVFQNHDIVMKSRWSAKTGLKIELIFPAMASSISAAHQQSTQPDQNDSTDSGDN